MYRVSFLLSVVGVSDFSLVSKLPRLRVLLGYELEKLGSAECAAIRSAASDATPMRNACTRNVILHHWGRDDERTVSGKQTRDFPFPRDVPFDFAFVRSIWLIILRRVERPLPVQQLDVASTALDYRNSSPSFLPFKLFSRVETRPDRL